MPGFCDSNDLTSLQTREDGHNLDDGICFLQKPEDPSEREFILSMLSYYSESSNFQVTFSSFALQ